MQNVKGVIAPLLGERSTQTQNIRSLFVTVGIFARTLRRLHDFSHSLVSDCCYSQVRITS